MDILERSECPKRRLHLRRLNPEDLKLSTPIRTSCHLSVQHLFEKSNEKKTNYNFLINLLNYCFEMKMNYLQLGGGSNVISANSFCIL